MLLTNNWRFHVNKFSHFGLTPAKSDEIMVAIECATCPAYLGQLLRSANWL